MDLRTKVILGETVAIVSLIVVFIIGVSIKNRIQKAREIELLNQIAFKDKTVEEGKGTYTKLELQLQNVQSVLDQKSVQVQDLEAQVKKDGQDIQSATSVSLKWKQAYEASVAASQSTVPPQNGQPERKRVDFSQDFGYIHTTGYTLTDPAYAWLKLEQTKPLTLTMAVTQGKDKTWRAYVTSSDSNMSADIVVSAVNPDINTIRWYERLSVIGQIGVGSSGVLAGAGLGLQLNRFDFGPSVWASVTDKASVFYGLHVAWHPFARE